MAEHTLLIPDLVPDASEILVTGDEAKHAVRVKRVRPGTRVRVLNGAGLLLMTEAMEIGKELRLRVLEKIEVLPIPHAINIWSASPKGPRASELVDGLSQVGATSWTAMKTERSEEPPTDKKIDRLERVALEAAKQSGRAWLLDIGSSGSFQQALKPPHSERLIIAAAAAPAFRWTQTNQEEPPQIRLLIGPEGGWTPEELTQAKDAGAEAASFGPHIMRIETAAPVATAIILHEAAQAGA